MDAETIMKSVMTITELSEKIDEETDPIVLANQAKEMSAAWKDFWSFTVNNVFHHPLRNDMTVESIARDMGVELNIELNEDGD